MFACFVTFIPVPADPLDVNAVDCAAKNGMINSIQVSWLSSTRILPVIAESIGTSDTFGAKETNKVSDIASRGRWQRCIGSICALSPTTNIRMSAVTRASQSGRRLRAAYHGGLAGQTPCGSVPAIFRAD